MSGAGLTIERWLSYDDASKLPDEMQMGGAGGWFNGPPTGNMGHTWKDYIEMWHDLAIPYIECIRAALLADGNRHGGFWHQSEGCPVFSDGRVFLGSMRAWGDLQAAVWTEHDGKPYSYCNFAWDDQGEADDASEKAQGGR